MTGSPEPVWTPSPRTIESSSLTAYKTWLEGRTGLEFPDYESLWRWSVEDIDAFWLSIWDYFEVAHSGQVGEVTDGTPMPGTRWFEGTEVNFAEHVFRGRDPGLVAIHAAAEDRPVEEVTWGELESRVAGAAEGLQRLGVAKGDRVVAYLPNSIETVASDLPLEEVPWPVGLLLVLGFATTVPLTALGGRFRFGGIVVAGLLAGLLYLVLCQLLFGAGVVLPVVAPLVALAIALIGTIAVQYTVEAFERQRVRETFARFVPDGVVDEVLELTGGDLRAGAARRECSVLFSDIRGFTTFSETRSPDEVVEILNHYLEAMTDTIMDHGGSVVSYLGDGILAVFGAPLEQDDHAERAVAAAREMVGSGLDGFNEWARGEGTSEGFRMGIGINTGPLMFGQIGSERRVEFTVIGDVVNTASRLEGMTKESGFDIFISDSTRQALGPEAPESVEVGEMDVKGRSGKVRVWAVPSPGQD